MYVTLSPAHINQEKSPMYNIQGHKNERILLEFRVETDISKTRSKHKGILLIFYIVIS